MVVIRQRRCIFKGAGLYEDLSMANFRVDMGSQILFIQALRLMVASHICTKVIIICSDILVS